jgi:membrane protein YqaA with SNARE-associated domain
VAVNATVFIVVPVIELAVIGLAAAQAYPPYLLGFVAGLGAGLGELTGYFVGSQGRHLVQHFSAKETGIMHRVQKLLSVHVWKGTATIFILASIPFPFDVVGIAAGLAKFPLPNFFIAATSGKIVRFTVLAYAALWGFTTIVNVFLHAA